MNAISRDTEAILLLCCRLPKDLGGEEHARALTHGEYIRLAGWLHENDLRPSNLLDDNWKGILEKSEDSGLDISRLSNLLTRGVSISFARERWERAGLWILSRADPSYPKRWKKILKNRAPALLFGAGSPVLLEAGGLGVVGSRNISDEVEAFVAELAKKSAINGINIVSGGARGVDRIAMQNATDANGKSLGVLADSLLKTIMRRDSRSSIENGRLTLVSPFSPEAGFNAGNAMARNKLIYASSDLVVVAQTDKGKGGTWGGATECLKQHWVPVLAQTKYPSDGLNALIARGAHEMDIPENNNFAEYFKSYSGKSSSQPIQNALL
jgi:predicted Rossmann fold nucleotide-binding protein DprA/Smf involved in DNA uptake